MVWISFVNPDAITSVRLVLKSTAGAFFIRRLLPSRKPFSHVIKSQFKPQRQSGWYYHVLPNSISRQSSDSPSHHIPGCYLTVNPVWISRPHTARIGGINTSTFQPRRIAPINRIPIHIIIPVQPILIPDGIGLHEPAKLWMMDPRLVIIKPKLGQPRLAGVLEPAQIGGQRNAERVSAPMPQCQPFALNEAWMLKQVQHDGVYEDHDAQNPIAKRPVFAEKLCVERA
jgi:hypothetical protein